MSEDSKIERFHLRHLSLTPAIDLPGPLAELKTLDLVLVEAVAASGVSGVGDAMILPGLTPETIEQAWIVGCKLAEMTAGMAAEEALGIYRQSHRVAPYTVTAISLAVEMACGGGARLATGELPLVSVLSNDDPALLSEAADALGAAASSIVRLRLSGDVDADRSAVAFLQRRFEGAARLRLDGDQAFTDVDALRFVEGLDPAGIDWLSQPCVAGDWDAAAALRAAAAVPMAITGFLYDSGDIETAAAEKAADVVCLRFAELGGLAASDQVLQTARECDLEVVLGHDLQSDLMASVEAGLLLASPEIAPDLSGGGICFESVLADRPALPFGDSMLRRTGAAALSEETLTACTVQAFAFSGGGPEPL